MLTPLELRCVYHGSRYIQNALNHLLSERCTPLVFTCKKGEQCQNYKRTWRWRDRCRVRRRYGMKRHCDNPGGFIPANRGSKETFSWLKHVGECRRKKDARPGNISFPTEHGFTPTADFS